MTSNRQIATDTVQLDLRWQPRVPLGELRPYLLGLQAGRAIASTCTTCGCGWFPPRLACPEHGLAAMGWRELSGRAEVLEITEARTALPGTGTPAELSLVFALVQHEGVANRALARLTPELATARPGQRVWISCIANATHSGPHPAQRVHYVAREDDRVTTPLPAAEG